MTAIASFAVTVLDCREPRVLAEFYSALIGAPIERAEDDWVQLKAAPGGVLAFQLAPDHQPPVWGDPGRPQQVHHDVMVDDLAEAERRVAALGARRLVSPDGSVWADPSGHPFCLIPRPGWAPPVSSTA